jgi:hypothetical protein
MNYLRYQKKMNLANLHLEAGKLIKFLKSIA